MEERIGNVILDLHAYQGEDRYSDGPVEDRLLSIVTDVTPSAYEEVIANEKDWAVLYHLSYLRENILSWYPFRGTEKVLEVGSGCGALTGLLADRCAQVACVELSKKRATIAATRHRDRDNICIHVGNFEEVRKDLAGGYDVITLIGVLEYGISYIHDQDPFVAFLGTIRELLADDGVVLCAIENRLGMKYFAGCTEDHTGGFFDGIEGYPDGGHARTFSKPVLEEIFRKAGFPEQTFYYPYPDYKFPDTIHSDHCLPKEGELTRHFRNFDRPRMVLFDETHAYDAAIRDGLYPMFANAFLVEARGHRP